MDVSNMRAAITGAYPGKRWAEKVSYMPENQVIAIYNHFVRDGVFNRTRVPKRSSDPNFRQLTLEDYGIDLRRDKQAV